MNTTEAIKAAREALEEITSLSQDDSSTDWNCALKQCASTLSALSAIEQQSSNPSLDSGLSSKTVSAEQQPEVYVVFDGAEPVYCASYRQACQEHINDAINEFQIEGAAKWKVVSYPSAPQASQPTNLEDIEQYRMQMAGISTAAIGYWKEGDDIHPDYDTVALRDVAKLYAKYDELFKAQASQPSAWNEAIEASIKRIDEIDDGEAPEYRACQEAIRALRQQAPAVQASQPSELEDLKADLAAAQATIDDFAQRIIVAQSAALQSVADHFDKKGQPLVAKELRVLALPMQEQQAPAVQEVPMCFGCDEPAIVNHDGSTEMCRACQDFAASHPAPAQTGEKTK